MKNSKPENIKRKAQKVFDMGDSNAGFLILYNGLPPNEFYTFCAKKHLKEIIFWNDYVAKPELLDFLNASGLMHQVLYDYFMKSGLKSVAFVSEIAQKFPNDLVLSIRRTGVFLNKDQLTILNGITLSGNYQVEQKSWFVLYRAERKIWNTIHKHAKHLAYIDLHKVLASLVHWIENERYACTDNKRDLHITEVYNFFISYYFSEYKVDLGTFYVHKIEDEFALLLEENVKNSLNKLCKEISNWIGFKRNVLDRFCYEDNFHLEQQEEKIIACDSIGYASSIKEGVRYIVNEEIYLNIANQDQDYYEENGHEVVLGETEEEVDRNRYFSIKQKATINLLIDLGVGKFNLGGEQIHAVQILALIQGFSQNLFLRYQHPLEQRKSIFKTFNLAYFDVFLEYYHKNIVVQAWICESKKDYLKRNRGVISKLNEKGIEELLQVVSKSPNDFEKFNRFQYKYDVLTTPYIRLKDAIFCPTFLLSQNNWFYSFAQLLLKNNTGTENQKKGTDKMEKYLTNKLIEKGWKALWLGENDSDKIPGDVDVLLHDENTLILIQIKRNQFRTDLKSAYNEHMISTKKAAKQLNKSVDHIQNHFDPQNKKKLEKWIVSTSFENVHTTTDGCLKINYFDLLLSLLNEEIRKLADLVLYVKADSNFMDTKALYLKQRELQDNLFYPSKKKDLPAS